MKSRVWHVLFWLFVAATLVFICWPTSLVEAGPKRIVQLGWTNGVFHNEGQWGTLGTSTSIDFALVWPLVGKWIGGVKVGVNGDMAPRLFPAVGVALTKKVSLIFPVGIQYRTSWFGKSESLLVGGGVQVGCKIIGDLSFDLALLGGTVFWHGPKLVLAFKPAFSFSF
jgi:hypothetical protein